MPIFLDPTPIAPPTLGQGMSLDEATQAVMDRGFDYLSTARIHMMLNAAKDEFEDVYEWPWLQKLVDRADAADALRSQAGADRAPGQPRAARA
jgi:hypothetical protein